MIWGSKTRLKLSIQLCITDIAISEMFQLDNNEMLCIH